MENFARTRFAEVHPPRIRSLDRRRRTTADVRPVHVVIMCSRLLWNKGISPSEDSLYVVRHYLLPYGYV